MKKIIVIVFILISVYVVIATDRIVTWDKTVYAGSKVAYDGDKLDFEDGSKVPKTDTVSYLLFNFNERSKGDDVAGTGQLQVSELTERAAYMQKKYPDAKSLVLYDDGIQKLNADGSRYSMSHYSVKIMNEKDLGYSLLVFYEIPGDTTTKIIFARSISPDGTVNNMSLDDITYSEPKRGLDSFSGRRDVKIMTATIPGVQVGSIIEFKYETVEAPFEDPKQYYTQWYFGGDDPVYESSVSIVVPEKTEYYFAIKNFGKKGLKPAVSVNDGYRTYRFTNGEMAPILSEVQGPPNGELLPYIKGSTFKNQDYLSAWISPMMKERMTIDDTVKKTVDAIISKSEAATEEEKISVLYRFMQEYIRYLSIKTSLSSGYTGHPANETFYNKYGDCIDKSILFATILGHIGVEAYPVIVMTNDQTQPLFGELGVTSANHAINEIHLKNPERIIYLDTTGVTYRYPYFRTDDHGIKAWNPILNTIRTVVPPPIEYNTQEYNSTIVLNSEGNAVIKNRNIYRGQMDSGLREYFLSLNDIQKKALLRNIISNEYPGSLLKDYKNSSPMDYDSDFSLEFEYEASNVAKKSGNYLIISIPVQYGFNYTNTTERKYDLVFETIYGEKNTVEFVLPEGYKPSSLPAPVKIKSAYIEYEGKYEFKDGKIVFMDHYKRLKKSIPAKDYKKLRQGVLKIDYFINIPVIIEKIAE